jgi:hypothetical protein
MIAALFGAAVLGHVLVFGIVNRQEAPQIGVIFSEISGSVERPVRANVRYVPVDEKPHISSDEAGKVLRAIDVVWGPQMGELASSECDDVAGYGGVIYYGAYTRSKCTDRKSLISLYQSTRSISKVHSEKSYMNDINIWVSDNLKLPYYQPRAVSGPELVSAKLDLQINQEALDGPYNRQNHSESCDSVCRVGFSLFGREWRAYYQGAAVGLAYAAVMLWLVLKR